MVGIGALKWFAGKFAEENKEKETESKSLWGVTDSVSKGLFLHKSHSI